MKATKPMVCIRCWRKYENSEPADRVYSIIEPGEEYFLTDEGVLCFICHDSDIPINHPAYRKK